jgi:hypothetical protein
MNIKQIYINIKNINKTKIFYFKYVDLFLNTIIEIYIIFYLNNEFNDFYIN